MGIILTCFHLYHTRVFLALLALDPVAVDPALVNGGVGVVILQVSQDTDRLAAQVAQPTETT